MPRIKLLFLFFLPIISSSQELSFGLEQIEGQSIIDSGLTGKGVKIGIIDGGFLRANTHPSLTTHFKNDNIGYYKDFVTPDMAEYGGSKRLNDQHGTHVWQMIGGHDLNKRILYGLATESTYLLARTDHGGYEKREEEKHLIKAIGEMARHGAQVINISLGYTNDYSNPKENYSPDQIDGKSTWITRSLDSLLQVHPLLIVLSAGNDGDAKWQTLSAPADSKYVLAVGATKYKRAEEMNYSAKGSERMDYVKPDVSCFSSSGTSFSAPTITGLAACILEYDSSLSPSRVKDIIIESSSLFPYPNNHVGYGVPSAEKILKILDEKPVEGIASVEATGKQQKIKVNIDQKNAIIYHKNGFIVLKKETIKITKPMLKVNRYGTAKSTTVLVGNNAKEIIWDK